MIIPSKPTVAGIFGGIGGGILGASWAGFDVLYNADPRKCFNPETFEINFPGTSKYLTDMQDVALYSSSCYWKICAYKLFLPENYCVRIVLIHHYLRLRLFRSQPRYFFPILKTSLVCRILCPYYYMEYFSRQRSCLN